MVRYWLTEFSIKGMFNDLAKMMLFENRDDAAESAHNFIKAYTDESRAAEFRNSLTPVGPFHGQVEVGHNLLGVWGSPIQVNESPRVPIIDAQAEDTQLYSAEDSNSDLVGDVKVLGLWAGGLGGLILLVKGLSGIK